MSQTTSTQVNEQHISTDGETIRMWAGRHNAVPVRERSDGTLDLIHESQIGPNQERLDWATFNDTLKDEDHAVSYHVGGLQTPSVLTYDKALSRSDIEDKQIRDRLVAGETVTSTIHETSSVETPVIEEATVESELVGREIINEELLNVELIERTCTDFSIVSPDEFTDADTFDYDRFFASLEASRNGSTQPDGESGVEPSLQYTAKEQYESSSDEPTYPYTTEERYQKLSVEPAYPYTTEGTYQTQIDIREIWMPTREVTERFTVESRITGTDSAEAETIEAYDLDVTGLQRSIIDQGMLGVEHESDEIKRDFEIESELAKGDTIHTHFTRTRVVEDKVIDQIQVYADIDIDRANFTDMDFTASEHVASEEATETMRSEPDDRSLTSDDVGTNIVDATGSNVGTVTAITDGGQTAYVEPHSSLTERTMSGLGWNDEGDTQKEVYVGQFAPNTDEDLQLKEHEQLAEHRQAQTSD